MFATRIKELRKKIGLTQVQFASQFKISNATIAMYETGKRQPDNEMLVRIADFFNVSVDYLLGHDNGIGEIIPCYTAEEKEIIDDYRTLSHDSCLLLKGYLKALVRMSSSNSSQSKEAIMKIDS